MVDAKSVSLPCPVAKSTVWYFTSLRENIDDVRDYLETMCLAKIKVSIYPV